MEILPANYKRNLFYIYTVRYPTKIVKKSCPNFIDIPFRRYWNFLLLHFSSSIFINVLHVS